MNETKLYKMIYITEGDFATCCLLHLTASVDLSFCFVYYRIIMFAVVQLVVFEYAVDEHCEPNHVILSDKPFDTFHHRL